MSKPGVTMSTSGLMLFAVAVVAIGIVVYLPFFFWFSRKRRDGDRLFNGKYGDVFPRGMYPGAVVLVASLLGALAWGEFNPESLLGRLVRMPGGMWLIRWAVVLALVVVAWSWFRAVSSSRRKADSAEREQDGQ